jgi:hypothetical protein
MGNRQNNQKKLIDQGEKPLELPRVFDDPRDAKRPRMSVDRMDRESETHSWSVPSVSVKISKFIRGQPWESVCPYLRGIPLGDFEQTSRPWRGEDLDPATRPPIRIRFQSVLIGFDWPGDSIESVLIIKTPGYRTIRRMVRNEKNASGLGAVGNDKLS